MNKACISLFLLFTLTLSLTDKEILQLSLNGIYEQNKLPDPKTVTDCGDDATNHKIVVFIGDALGKAAKGSVTDLVSLVSEVKNFIDSLPQSFSDCMGANPEVDTLAVAYNVKGVDSATIERKIITYTTLHYLSVHKWMVELDGLWTAGSYYQFGFNGGGYLHNMLGMNLYKMLAELRK